jgi:hypothetical protein
MKPATLAQATHKLFVGRKTLKGLRKGPRFFAGLGSFTLLGTAWLNHQYTVQ